MDCPLTLRKVHFVASQVPPVQQQGRLLHCESSTERGDLQTPCRQEGGREHLSSGLSSLTCRYKEVQKQRVTAIEITSNCAK